MCVYLINVVAVVIHRVAAEPNFIIFCASIINFTDLKLHSPTAKVFVESFNLHRFPSLGKYSQISSGEILSRSHTA